MYSSSEEGFQSDDQTGVSRSKPMSRDLHLDTGRLADIFKARIKNTECPFCEHDEWELPLQAGATGVGLPWSCGKEYLRSGTPAVMLNCTYCGFIRLHSLSVLADIVVEDTSNAGALEVCDE
ncbi:hypothetical protein [Pseudomonas sp. NPDC099000]|uniref:hypothetical protein n=1 Tax=Pseudomonas sp. NPDC099000 TaxID=3364488 RepID=UPI00383B1E9F